MTVVYTAEVRSAGDGRSGTARSAVTAKAPELKTKPEIHQHTVHQDWPQYKPLPGFELLELYRYPVHHAKTIQPPENLKLTGSSHEFIDASKGNAYLVPTAGIAFVEVGTEESRRVGFVA